MYRKKFSLGSLLDISTIQGERKLARGTFYNILSKATYLICAYTIHFSLGRILGPHDYGIFGSVFAVFNLIFLFFTIGMPNSIAKHIAGNKLIAYQVTKAAMRVQLVCAIFLFVLLFGGAEFIASVMLNDNGMAHYIRLAAFSVIPLALQTVYAGALLGIREFSKEALALILRSIVRVVLVLGIVVLLGLGIDGAIYGYVGATIFGVLVLRSFCKFPKSDSRYDMRKLIAFAIPLMFSAATVSLLSNIDIILVKRIIGYNSQVGFYTAASTMSHSLYYLAAAFGATLLPSIARSYENNDIPLTKKYVLQSTRYLLIIVVPIVAIVSATSKELIELVYGNSFLSASLPLSVLIFGFAFFSFSILLNTVIAAIGHPWISTSLCTMSVLLSLICNVILISIYGLLGAAVATTIACVFFLILSGVYVFKKLKILINLLSFFRISVAGIFIYITAKILPISSMTLPLYYILLLFLYVTAIFILREPYDEDYEVLRGILGKKAQAIPVVEAK